MKKYLALFCMFSALVACNKINEEINPNQGETDVVYKISINHDTDDATTKAVKSGWENGDVVNIFFSNISAGKYLKAQYNGTSWTFTPMGGLTKADYVASGATATAVYFPFDQDNTPIYSGGWTFAKKYYAYYLTAEKAAYTFSTGDVMNLTLDMSVPEGFVQFFVVDPSAVSGSYALTESHITPQALTGVGTDGTVITDAKTAGYAIPGYAYGSGAEKGYLFSGILAAGARNVSTAYSINLVKQDPTEGYAINTSVLNKTTTLYTSATTKRALKLPALNTTNWGVYQIPFVDLGIEDGLFWSTGNLMTSGIAAPDERGLFYTWGGKTGYDKTADKNEIFAAVEYTPADKYSGHGELITNVDDAAYAVNTNWRMPTRTEVNNLIKKTSIIRDAENGYAKITGTNGLTLYLLDAGYFNNYQGYRHNGNLNYWTSTYTYDESSSVDKSVAWYITLEANENRTYSWARLQIAAPIRPVMPNS